MGIRIDKVENNMNKLSIVHLNTFLSIFFQPVEQESEFSFSGWDEVVEIWLVSDLIEDLEQSSSVFILIGIILNSKIKSIQLI